MPSALQGGDVPSPTSYVVYKAHQVAVENFDEIRRVVLKGHNGALHLAGCEGL